MEFADLILFIAQDVAPAVSDAAQAAHQAADPSAAGAAADAGMSTSQEVGIWTVVTTILGYFGIQVRKDFLSGRERKAETDPEKLAQKKASEELDRNKLVAEVADTVHDKVQASLSEALQQSVREITTEMGESIRSSANLARPDALSVQEIVGKTREIHQWLQKEDARGAKLIYSPREDIRDLVQAVTALNQTMLQSVKQQASLEGTMREYMRNESRDRRT